MQFLKTLLKFFLAVLSSFLAVLCTVLIAIVACVTLIDPNHFKDPIQKAVLTHTGCTLTLQGPVYWQFDPGFSLEMHDLSLQNAASLENKFLTLKKVRFETKPWSVFSGKLPITIEINGLNAHLNRAILKHPSWQSIQKILFAPNKMKLFAGMPDIIALHDASFDWQDPVTNQHLEVKNLSLFANHLVLGMGSGGMSAPITSTFQFKDLSQHRSGKIAFNGVWSLDRASNTVEIKNVECTAAIANLPSAIVIGAFRIQNFNHPNPVLEGTLKTLNFPLQLWLSEFNLPPALSPKTVDLKSTFKYDTQALTVDSVTLSWGKHGLLEGAFQTNLQGNTVNGLDIHGSLHGQEIQIGFLPTITKINASFAAREGILTVHNLNADWMNTQHNGTLIVDYKSRLPHIAFTDHLQTPEANELLSFLGHKDKISGKMEANVTLQTQGHTLDECVSNLAGQAHVTLTDGKLQGIGLPELLRHAQFTMAEIVDQITTHQPINVEAMLTAELGEWKEQAISVKPRATPFRTIETDITADNGTLSATHFALSHPDYTIHGTGNLNLPERIANCQAEALLSTVAVKTPHAPNLMAYLQKQPLSIHLYGAMEDLIMRPDLGHYAEGAMQLAQEKPLDPSTQETLEKLFGF